MATLNDGAASITLTKQNNTLLTLSTDKTYVDGDVQFTLGVQSGAGAADTASADADVESTDDSNVGGVNISDVIGAKTTTEPSSGYYIRIKASGSGNSKITTAGWLDTGALSTASTTAVKYFPVDGAVITQNAPTIDSSTGIVTATTSTTKGYTPTAATAASNTLSLSTQAAATITPTRSEQTAVAAGKYTLGVVKVGAIPNTYYTMAEAIASLYPVGSYYATDDSTDNPATTLGIGTWSLVSPTNTKWGDLYNENWNTPVGNKSNIYVYLRTA